MSNYNSIFIKSEIKDEKDIKAKIDNFLKALNELPSRVKVYIALGEDRPLGDETININIGESLVDIVKKHFGIDEDKEENKKIYCL